MKFFRRLVTTLATRALEAAGGGRRWAGVKTIANWNSTIQASAIQTRQRTRWASMNNPWLTKAIGSLVANLVGTGIKPQSTHADEAVRAELHRRWNLWTDFADAGGITDFYGLTAIVARALVVDGECFVRFLAAGPRGFNLQVIAADQVDASINRELGGGNRIVAGIEFDAAGARVAYHILPNTPGEAFPVSLTPVRVPAPDICHIFEPIAPGQVRGISWAASVLLRLHEIDQIEDAGLVRQKVAAMFAGFITDQNGDAGGFAADGTQKGSVLDGGLEPGALKVLPNGADIKFSEPAQVGDMIDFLRLQLRAVAAGLGVMYEQLTGDLSGVNYSSIRAGLIEFRRRIEAVQYSVLVFQFCRPIWQRFILTEILTGRLAGKVEDFAPVNWVCPGFAWVDPLKDAEAEGTAIAAGLMSRRQAVAARGYDVEALDAEIAADNARAAKLGLVFTAPTPSKQETSDNAG
jgi:lambda family phage portal protein